MKQPNILFIVADHHTWHGIAARSPARTPNLNRLADDGLLFERSYTPISVCCPARAMLASGAYPWHNGVYNQVHVAPSLSRDMKEDVVTYYMARQHWHFINPSLDAVARTKSSDTQGQ